MVIAKVKNERGMRFDCISPSAHNILEPSDVRADTVQSSSDCFENSIIQVILGVVGVVQQPLYVGVRALSH